MRVMFPDSSDIFTQVSPIGYSSSVETAIQCWLTEQVENWIWVSLTKRSRIFNLYPAILEISIPIRRVVESPE